MSPEQERAYSIGHKMAFRQMLGECIRQLGEEDREKSDWIAERADAINALRMICERHGDNDWPDDLYLADIIDKHLWRYLEE